jgi:hypothetical protein
MMRHCGTCSDTLHASNSNKPTVARMCQIKARGCTFVHSYMIGNICVGLLSFFIILITAH